MSIWYEEPKIVRNNIYDRVWEDLAQAIIVQAVKDYRLARARLKKKPDDVIGKKLKREVEAFFRSWWFSILTDVEPEIILRGLQEEESA